MNIQLQNGKLRMSFDVDAVGRLNLRRIAADDSEPTETKSVRSAVEIGSNPGFGSWDKKVNTDSASLRYVTHRDIRLDDGFMSEFDLADDRFFVTLHYRFWNGVDAFSAWTTVKNISGEPQDLLYVSSFHYNGLEVPDVDKVMICHNGWRTEGQIKFYTPDDLGLPRLKGISSKKLVVGNTGTFTTKDYLPIGYAGGLYWQVEHNSDWRWELSDCDSNLYISLAGESEEDGWRKILAPNESYESAKCAVAVGTDFDEALCEMTRYRRKIKGCNAEYAKQPLIFNDFMHCIVTNPTTENEREMTAWAAKAGAEYYVMDAGWYADGHWWDSVGEWKPSQKRFTNGLGEVFDMIRANGMKPGIWLEPEVMGINCPLAKEWEDECFWIRYGKRVVNRQRYQLDYRHPRVLDHMNETIDRLIREYGICYFKFDYNIDAGIGTEVDADSFADGADKCRLAFLDWVHRLQAKYPHVIFENCSSGAMRENYDMLSTFCLQSTSDQEDFRDTAPIAVNSAVGVLPEQAGIWVCPLAGMERNKLTYCLVNGLCGVFYLAGRPNEQGDNFDLLCEATALYKEIRGKIKDFLPSYPLGFSTFKSDRHCVLYRAGDESYLYLWQNGDTGTFSLPVKAMSCECIFPKDNNYKITLGDTLTVDMGHELTAGVFRIR